MDTETNADMNTDTDTAADTDTDGNSEGNEESPSIYQTACLKLSRIEHCQLVELFSF